MICLGIFRIDLGREFSDTLEKQLFGSVTVIGAGNSIFAAIVAPPPGSTGGSQNVAADGGTAMVQSFASGAPVLTSKKISGVERGATELLRRARLIGAQTGRWAESMLKDIP